MKYLRYLRSLMAHKWYVFLAGRRVGVPVWRLIIHDWSKFLPSEFIPYARYFYGDYPEDKGASFLHLYQGPFKHDIKRAFDRAWLLHQNRQPHHWQFWILINDQDGTYPLPMPETYVREMVADWMGASMAYTGSWDMGEWLAENMPGYMENMHSQTISSLDSVLMAQGYVRIPAGGIVWEAR